jgi:hypothetical protein
MDGGCEQRTDVVFKVEIASPATHRPTARKQRKLRRNQGPFARPRSFPEPNLDATWTWHCCDDRNHHSASISYKYPWTPRLATPARKEMSACLAFDHPRLREKKDSLLPLAALGLCVAAVRLVRARLDGLFRLFNIAVVLGPPASKDTPSHCEGVR